MNVYIPDELAERVRASGVDVSTLTQAAIIAELDGRTTDAWLDGLAAPRRPVSHDAALTAVDDVRDERSGDEGRGAPVGGAATRRSSRCWSDRAEAVTA